MANTRQIPWRRILLEGAVIVVSILLAFSIDTWWSSRIEQQREHEQLVSMHAEFNASLSGLDAVLTSIQGHAKNVELLIALLKAAGDEPVLVPGQARLPAILLDVTEDEIVAQNFAESEMSVFLARESLAESAYAHRAGVPGSERVLADFSLEHR